MRNLKYYIAFTALIALISCEDFLDFRPEATVTSSGIDHTKSENIYLPISAAYAKMRSFDAHAFAYIGAFEIASDNADKGSSAEDNPTMKELDLFTYQSTNSLVNDLWNGYFDIVSGANNAIQEMPLFEAQLADKDDQAYAHQCAGEAYAIRGYAYFNLTRLFGRVPIIDTTLTADQLAQTTQASTAQLYDFIEDDLMTAINLLPTSYASKWTGRINKYTAMGLKAKVHLYQQEWDSVAHLTDQIIASGQFGLLSDFREVFSIDGENSEESLFEIQSSTLGNSTGDQTYIEYAYVQGPRGNTPGNMQGWGFCTPSQNLIDFFTVRGETVRAATTFLYRGTKTPEGDSIKHNCTNPVYNGKVYTPSSYNLWSYNGYGFDHNVRILRYADILLMFAEAKARGASVATTCGLSADDAVNLVRQRAGLDPISGVSLQNIWDERRAELALEEDRFFDLVRTGQAASTLASKGFSAGKNEVYPIPNSQLQLNTHLTQNNGYN